VGLAPVAAALLLLSTGAGGLRVAAVLTILTVVLVGLSIMLRPDARTVRVDIEDQLFDEIDALRESIRQDIAGAARATHRANAEKLQAVWQTVETLRTQVEALRSGTPDPVKTSMGSSMVAGGVVRHTETVQVTTRQMISVDPDRGTGTVYGTRHAEPAPAARPAHGARPGEESWTEQRLRERLAEVRPEPRRAEHEQRRPRPYEREQARHYPREDAQVYPREDAQVYPREESRAYHGEESRAYHGEESRAYHGEESRAYHRDQPRPHAWSAEPADEPNWSGMRTGDRWAAVRTDERGQELRMGSRRAAVRSDDTGTELHLEDRWAQVRRDDDEWERTPAHGWGPSEPRAITATGPEPASAWTEGWRELPPPANPRPRRPDYEMSDNRWR
jgi:hypothetical protein